MKINKLFLAGVLISMCIACIKESPNSETKMSGKNVQMGDFPEEVLLSEVKGTEFALTLENKLSDSKNSIYAPAFLFAWQEIKNFYKSPIEVSDLNSQDFKLINESNTFKDALNKDEYETTVNEIPDGVEASAYFKKTLPFAVKFHPQQYPIIFGTSEIKSFGVNYPDDSLSEYFEILYYLDDEHFAIKLYPADTTSEIILAKGINLSGTFTELLANTNKWIGVGRKEKKVKEKAWRYKFEERDYVSIPVMKFNIGTNYSSLEGQTFTTDSKQKEHMILKAYQRTAFMLDEYGAVVESYADVVAVDSVGPAHVEVSTPKRMIFDKPFVIFIKKKDSSNPYFAMKVVNAELMEKK